MDGFAVVVDKITMISAVHLSSPVPLPDAVSKRVECVGPETGALSLKTRASARLAPP